jgi:limonene-1,2-epoxide hydrolase
MGTPEEDAVRKFWAEAEVPDHHWDAAHIDRLVRYMTPDIHYHVYAWEDPVVGRDAVREELLRQAPLFHDFLSEVVTVASQGNTVFMERRDSMKIGRKPLTQHCVGVFEIDAEGKISAWRDYYDSKEIAVKLSADVNRVSTAGARGYDS